MTFRSWVVDADLIRDKITTPHTLYTDEKVLYGLVPKPTVLNKFPIFLYFPLDSQFLEDDKCIKIICKGLALRYRINKGK